ncbi:MAG TPA: GNAT family protein [Opitutaceae bacterium]|nr:GNAT family protein [Opitutaceae bacterium]
MSRFDPRPVVLAGRVVRLEPLQAAHAAGLYAVGQDPEIHRYLLGPAPASLADVEATVAKALAAAATGVEVPFAIVHLATGRVAGTTRYFDIRRKDRVLEIGHTWLGRAFQRTAVNTEAKYLLLCHAFEELGAARVQLKTDERNERSRRAIERLGAQFEGILRRYQTRWDGFVRNTAMYAIVSNEWPAVKAGLEAKLARS